MDPLGVTLNAFLPTLPALPDGMVSISGVALMGAWSFGTPKPASELSSALCKHLAKGRHRTTQPRFVSYKIVECMRFETPMLLPEAEVPVSDEEFSVFVRGRLLSKTVENESWSGSLHDLRRRWRHEYELLRQCFVASRLHPRFCELLLNGVLDCDLACLVLRDRRRELLHPSQPPAALITNYLREGRPVTDAPRASDAGLLHQSKSASSYGGFVEGFSCHHLVRALKVSLHTKNVASVFTASRAGVDFFPW